MQTGSTKSALYQYLSSVILRVRKECGYRPIDAVWLLGDATCEKMGDLMAANDGRLLGLYDELTSFLTQLNLYRGKGLTLSHELALFLQLYNGHAWSRTTGVYSTWLMYKPTSDFVNAFNSTVESSANIYWFDCVPGADCVNVFAAQLKVVLTCVDWTVAHHSLQHKS